MMQEDCLPVVREDEELLNWKCSNSDRRPVIMPPDSDVSVDLVSVNFDQLEHDDLVRQVNDMLVTRLNCTGRPDMSRLENDLLAAQSLIHDLQLASAASAEHGDQHVTELLVKKHALTADNLQLTHCLCRMQRRQRRLRQRLHEMAELNELQEFRILELQATHEQIDECKAENLSSSVAESLPAELDTDIMDSRVKEGSEESSNGVSLCHEQLDSSWQTERRDYHQKIVLLQSSILQLESALVDANAEVQRGVFARDAPELRTSGSQTVGGVSVGDALTCCVLTEVESCGRHRSSTHGRSSHRSRSLSPLAGSTICPLTLPAHQRSPSGGSDSELSDYHSDTTDSRTPQPSTAVDHPAGVSNGTGVFRRMCSCGAVVVACTPSFHLQESGIFEAEAEDKAVQTDVQQNDVSMRELIDLGSEIARLTSVQKTLECQNPDSVKCALPIDAVDRTAGCDGAASDVDQFDTGIIERAAFAEPSSLPTTCTAVQTDYHHDQLLLDLADLREQLEKTSLKLEEVEEERNEFEEAENDARLMVQRLEMKVYASGEVEKMLSSDLAEEQERSRTLQRQLNSVKLKRQAEVKALQSDPERLKLLNRIKEQDQLVQTLECQLKQMSDSVCTKVDVAVGSDEWLDWREVNSSDSQSEDSEKLCSSVVSSPSNIGNVSGDSQTGLATQLKKSWSFQDANSLDKAPSSDHFPSRPSKRVREDDTEDSQISISESERLCGVSESSRCANCNKLLSADSSDSSSCESREHYYTECIKKLEAERSASRKLWEAERSNLVADNNESSRKLAQCHEKLLNAVNDSECAKQKSALKIDQLEKQIADQAADFEKERCKIIAQGQQAFGGLSEQCCQLQNRLSPLEEMFTLFATVLETNTVPMGPGSLESSISTLVERVKLLKESNRDLCSRVHDLENKEAAYQETMLKADNIMRDEVSRYQNRIEDLETQLARSKALQTALESNMHLLERAQKHTDNSGDKGRLADLLSKLVNAEVEVTSLMGKVVSLEKREHELSMRLREEENTCSSLRHAVSEHEDMVRDIEAYKQEVLASKERLDSMGDARQRVLELQENDEFLRGRIDELEQVENCLQETIKQMKTSNSQKDKLNSDQINIFKSELEAAQSGNQSLLNELKLNQDERDSLKKELQEVRELLSEECKELTTANSTFSQLETQLRNEVAKLRCKLDVVNSQLTEHDIFSGKLREKLELKESENERLKITLAEHERKAEQEHFRLQCELSVVEQKLVDVSTQLHRSQLAVELDSLASHESAFTRLLAQLQHCNRVVQSCGGCRGTLHELLETAISQLQLLVSVLAGASNNVTVSDSTEQYDQSLECQLRRACLEDGHAKHLCLENWTPRSLSPAATQSPSVIHPITTTQAQTNCQQQQQQQQQQHCDQIQQVLDDKERELSLLDEQGARLQTELECSQLSCEQLRQQLADSQRQLLDQLQQLRQLQLARDCSEARANSCSSALSVLITQLSSVISSQQADALVSALQTPATISHATSDSTDMSCASVDEVRRTMARLADTIRQRETRCRNESLQLRRPSRNRRLMSRIPRPLSVASSSSCTSSSSDSVTRCFAPPSSKTRTRVHVAANSAGMNLGTACASQSVRSSISLPPPQRFQVIKQVGPDALLVFWSPPRHHRVTGYQIFVDNKLHQVVRNAGRSKALLPSLKLNCCRQLAIRSQGDGGQLSQLVWAQYTPSGERHDN